MSEENKNIKDAVEDTAEKQTTEGASAISIFENTKKIFRKMGR